MTADSGTGGFRHFHDQLSALKETLLGMLWWVFGVALHDARASDH